jgi:hypothetical protein
MEQLATLARWEMMAVLICIAGTIVYKIAAGTISLKGLLTGERRDGNQYFSPGRAQLLLVTLIMAGLYVKRVAANPSITSLPEIPSAMVAVLATSQAFYLADKIRALFFGLSATNSRKGSEP